MAQVVFAKFAVIGFICLIVTVLAQESDKCPKSESLTGDVTRCKELMHLSQLGVKDNFWIIPGFGWDNLENKPAGRVVTYTYRECKTTDDGKLVIPDNVLTVPVKKSSKATFTEVFSDFQSVTSSDSKSINAIAGLGSNLSSLSGSFSEEKKMLMKQQPNKDSAVIRNQLRLVRYNIWLQPDTPFSPSFEDHLALIAANVELGYNDSAAYEAERLISQFGTHVITKIVAGAAIVKTDFMQRDFVLIKQTSADLRAGAAATFKEAISLTALFDYLKDPENKHKEEYTNNLLLSTLTSNGGIYILPETNSSSEDLKKWLDSVDNHLVALDKSGAPIQALITTKSLPYIPAQITSQVAEHVKKAINKYYQSNAIFGCTDSSAHNFNPNANIDNGSCKEITTGINFGGFFTTCYYQEDENSQIMCQNVQDFFMFFDRHDETELFCILYNEIRSDNHPCAKLNIANPTTKNSSCPEHYTRVALQSGNFAVEFNFLVCHRLSDGYSSCHPDDLWCRCHLEPRIANIAYTSHWCASSSFIGQETFFFGGLYTNTTNNHVTGKQTCPYSFTPLNLMLNTTICITTNEDHGKALGVPFGGFKSCQKNSTVQVDGPTSNGCPHHFIPQYFQDRDCNYTVCITTRKTFVAKPLIKPPFMKKPADKGVSDYTWVRLDSTPEATPLAIAVLCIATALICLLVLAALIFIVEKVQQNRTRKPQRSQISMKDQESDSDSI